MASSIDMSLDSIVQKKFASQKKFHGIGNAESGGYRGAYRGGLQSKSSREKQSDLRSLLTKKQSSNITDLRTKLKPKALYTSNLTLKSRQAILPVNAINDSNSQGRDNSQGRKKLNLTSSFKNSISSAVVTSTPREEHKSTRSQSQKSDPPVSHHRSSSHRLPSYEEAKKISVTVPGTSRPVSEVRCYNCCCSTLYAAFGVFALR